MSSLNCKKRRLKFEILLHPHTSLIAGGGLASPIIGIVADIAGDLRIGMVVFYLTLAYISAIGFWAKPLVNNKTFKLFKSTNDSASSQVS